MNSEIDTIMNYYNTVEKPVITEFCKNVYFKNLLKLSTKTDLYLLSKRNKKWCIKETKSILNECTKKKKKEIKNTVSALSNLAKLCPKDSILQLKATNTKLEDKLSQIDSLIDHVKLNLDTDTDTDEYLECYSNC
jgi:hypothetical protein